MNIATTLKIGKNIIHKAINTCAKPVCNPNMAVMPQIKDLDKLKFLDEGVTFIRQNISKSEKMIDDFLIEQPKLAEDVETLGVRLFKQIRKSGKNYVATNEVQTLTKITGLTEQELSQNFDEIASLFTLLKDSQSLWYMDAPYKMSHKIGKQVVEIAPISRGCSGTVYRITFPNSKSVVLKKYHGNTFDISAVEGCYPEVAIQQKMTNDGVENIAKLLISNPDNGWIVSEFIDETYKIKKTGYGFDDFMKKHNLIFDDINGGMYVQDASSNNVLVDFGYIMHPNNVTTEYSKLLRDLATQLKEEKERKFIDFEKVVNQYIKNPKERFKIIQELEVFADKDFCKMFFDKIIDTPQMQLYTKYSEYLGFKINKYQTDISIEELQKLMMDCNINVDINDFIGNQNFTNINSLKFNDYLTPMMERLGLL